MVDELKLNHEAICSYNEKTIDFAIAQAEKAVENLSEKAQRISERATTMMGWIIAAATAVIGIIVSWMSNPGAGSPMFLYVSCYLLLILTASALILVRGTLLGRYTSITGIEPAYYLNQPTFVGLDDKLRTKTLKVWVLHHLQGKYEENEKELAARVKSYRIAAIVLLCGALAGLAVGVLLCVFTSPFRPGLPAALEAAEGLAKFA